MQNTKETAVKYQQRQIAQILVKPELSEIQEQHKDKRADFTDDRIAHFMQMARKATSVYHRNCHELVAQIIAEKECRPIPQLSEEEKAAIADRDIAENIETADTQTSDELRHLFMEMAKTTAEEECRPMPNKED
ncbi:uncharacterized protein PV07_04714 [Cladophialophora immunda]|uniref:Uncharacterized protein n=1 Tax=Cladophialophora immunda TaxID=569365 RepID=A0A0D1ZLK8_9EURO|nr:uncharacterized protein PV07_04714 [Cladophialophora immunda]KIW28851.1 hypothetical protein PV07_04714 [Cladophialophora immunda]